MERLVPAQGRHERHTTLETPHTHMAVHTRPASARTRQGNRHARPTSLPDGETTQQGDSKMKKTGAFNPRKFKLTIESWEGEDFSATFDKGPDCWPLVHGLPLDLKNRMFYQDMADEIERFAKRVIRQMQFIATRFDEKGRGVEPYGSCWIPTRGGSLPEWRLINPHYISGMEAEGWKVCEVEHRPYQNPDMSTIYVIVPPKSFATQPTADYHDDCQERLDKEETK